MPIANRSFDPLSQAEPKGLGWRVRTTWAGIVVERAARTFWPAWSLLFLAFAANAFSRNPAIPVEIAAATVLGIIAAAAVFSLIGCFRFRFPTRDEAVRKLDRTDPNRPILSFRDRLAINSTDSGTAALWDTHLTSSRAAVAKLRPPAPNLDLSKFDPYALRHISVTALVIAVIFAPNDGDFMRLSPLQWHAAAFTAEPTVDAWLEPPRLYR